jgi:hypothetical protein
MCVLCVLRAMCVLCVLYVLFAALHPSPHVQRRRKGRAGAPRRNLVFLKADANARDVSGVNDALVIQFKVAASPQARHHAAGRVVARVRPGLRTRNQRTPPRTRGNACNCGMPTHCASKQDCQHNGEAVWVLHRSRCPDARLQRLLCPRPPGCS